MNPTGDGVLPVDGGPPSPRLWDRIQRPEAAVFLLFVLALTIRILIVARTGTIAADGATYLKNAEFFMKGQFETGYRSQGLQPLFPMTAAVFGTLARSVETGAYIASVLASALTVIPIFWLGVLFFNVRAGVWSGFLYAFHPTLALEASEVRNTGLFLFLFVAALTLFLYALRDGSWPLYALSGITGTFCYLTRSEGLPYLGLFMAGATAVKFVRLLLRKVEPGAPGRLGIWTRFVGGTSLTAAVFLMTSFPWILFLHGMAGRWFPAARGGAVHVLLRVHPDDPDPNTPPPPPAPPAPSPVTPPAPNPPPAVQTPTPPIPPPAVEPPRPAPPETSESKEERRTFVYACLKKISRATFGPFIPLALIGIIVAWKDRRSRASSLGLLSMVAVTGLVPIGAWWMVPEYHLSDRYLLPAIPLLLPFMGLAAVTIQEALTSRVASRMPSRGPLLVPALMALIVLGTALPKIGPARRADEASFLEAAAWLRAQAGSKPKPILTSSDKISFHAGLDAVPLPMLRSASSYARKGESLLPEAGKASLASPTDAAQTALQEIRRTGARFVVLDEKSVEKSLVGPVLRALEAAGLSRAATFGDPAKKTLAVWIYRAPS